MKRCVRCAAGFVSEAWICPGCGFAPARADGFLAFAPELAATVAGYDAGLFAAHGGAIGERSFWARGRAALIAWALGRHAPGARRFLEVGCGTGGVLAHLEHAFPELELVGVEALVEGLRAARARVSRAQLVQADAARLPYDAEFDAAGAFDVIEHIDDDEAVLAALVAAVRPGGTILVTVPQHRWLYGPADVAARHVRRYTRRELAAKIRRAGGRIELATSFVSLLFPAMAAVRLAGRWRGGAYDSAEEYPSGALNTLGVGAMALERWTIRRGVRWPFGGSLLVVAQKGLA